MPHSPIKNTYVYIYVYTYGYIYWEWTDTKHLTDSRRQENKVILYLTERVSINLTGLGADRVSPNCGKILGLDRENLNRTVFAGCQPTDLRKHSQVISKYTPVGISNNVDDQYRAQKSFGLPLEQ